MLIHSAYWTDLEHEDRASNLRPYKQTFGYDAFGHMVQRPVNQWWSGGGGGFTHQDYANERNVHWQYDADGHLVNSGDVQYTVDAAGRIGRTVAATENTYKDPNDDRWGFSNDVTQGFDGDGQAIKKVAAETTIYYNHEGDTTTTTTTYLVRSSVLKGQVLTEVSDTGQKQRTFVYLGSEVLGRQQQALDNTQAVVWEHRDASNASYRVTASDGAIVSGQSAELDPLGTNAGTSNPIPNPQLKSFWSYPGFGDTNMSSDSQCMLDGTLEPCSLVFRAAAAGALSSLEIPAFTNGTVPSSMPVKVIDPTTYGDPTTDPNSPQPNASLTIYAHEHYEWVPTGEITTSIQQRQPQNTGQMQQQRGYQPLKRGESGDNGLSECFRAQFAASRKAQEQYASENALSLKPNASTVVVAVATFVVAAGFTRQPALSALAAGAVSVAKDVVGDNVVRIGKRIASSVNNQADLNIKLGNCYRERGQEPPAQFLPDSLRAAYGTP